jgi:hypothetical protein
MQVQRESVSRISGRLRQHRAIHHAFVRKHRTGGQDMIGKRKTPEDNPLGRITCITAVFAVCLCSHSAVMAQAPVSTAFTYQGRLLDAGVAPTGSYDLQFRLFTAPLTPPGVQVGATQVFDNVSVTNGLFTVVLDFGTQFPGSARWLDIGVHPGALPVGNPYTLLTPRQELTGTPYAIGVRLPLSESISNASAALNIFNTGTGHAGRFDGPDNNGTTAALSVVSGSQIMLLDGNELDSMDPGGLFINNNTDGNVVVATGGGHLGVRNSAPPASLSVGSPTVLNVYVPGDSTCFTAQATPGCSDPGCENLVCAIDAFCCNSAWDSVCVGEANTNCIGRVGIGTSAPEVRVHISGGTDASLDGGGFLVMGSTTGTNLAMDNNEIVARNNGAASSLAINADGGNVNILQNGGGNVGIGTTSPSALLHAVGSVNSDRGAVYGVQNAGSTGGGGVFGLSTLSSGNGVIGEANTGVGAFGVWGMSTSNEAGHFSGDVDIVGALSKDSGSFKIDHPLDPANKYLYHSFVESPDMMNVYNGNVVTDKRGYATVNLPDWFGVLNRDFRYQLTVLDDADSDTFVSAKVVRKIADNRFTIRTSAPNVEVSWQVTGVRQDPWANAHRMQVEVDKPDYERGFYRHPELYGQPRSKKIEEALRPGSMTRTQEPDVQPAGVPVSDNVPVQSSR